MGEIFWRKTCRLWDSQGTREKEELSFSIMDMNMECYIEKRLSVSFGIGEEMPSLIISLSDNKPHQTVEHDSEKWGECFRFLAIETRRSDVPKCTGSSFADYGTKRYLPAVPVHWHPWRPVEEDLSPCYDTAPIHQSADHQSWQGGKDTSSDTKS